MRSAQGRQVGGERNKRRCTDIPCCIAFLIGMGVLIAITVVAFEEGNLEKIVAGSNYKGEVCGHDEAVKDKPYLFYCRSYPLTDQLDTAHPICVQACPTSDLDTKDCYDPDASESALTSATNAVPTYDSRLVFGRMCLPKDDALEDKLWEGLQGHLFEYMSAEVAQYIVSWQALLLAAAIGLLLSFIYLALLSCFVKCIVRVVLLLLILIPLIMGTLMILYSQDQIPDSWVEATGNWLDDWEEERNKTAELVVGILLVLFGLFLTCLTCCNRDPIDNAALVIEVACECVLSSPLLLLQPIFALVVQLALLLWAIVTFFLLLTAGKETTSVVNGAEVKEYSFTDEQIGMLVAFVVLSIWLFEFWRAWSEFSIAYGVEAWCKQDYGQRGIGNPISWIIGYFHGLWHIGSFAFGASLMVFFDLIRLMLRCVETICGGPQGCVAGCIRKCCGCIQACIGAWSRLAYVEIGYMETEGFCLAMAKVAATVSAQKANFAALLAFVPFFEVLGLVFVTVVGGFLMLEIVTRCYPFNDDSTENYIMEPGAMAFVAGFICLFVAIPVMIVLGMAAEVILYFFAREELSLKDGDIKKGSSNACTWLFAPTCGGSSSQTEGRVHQKHPKLREALDDGAAE